MEQIIRNLINAPDMLSKFLVIWAVFAPFFYAYLMSFAILMWKVANRKPDNDGNITEFNRKYLMRNKVFYIWATVIFIFFATLVILHYWSTADAVLLGTFVGVLSHYLGKLVEYAGEQADKRARKEIDKINGPK